MSRFTLLLSLSLVLPIATVQAAEPVPVKAVLVTGASTGIGRNLTEHLAAAGYFVYAGARKEADLKALGAIKNVQAIKLDVTSPEDIAAAVTGQVEFGIPCVVGGASASAAMNFWANQP